MLLDFTLYNPLDDPTTHVSIRVTTGESSEKDSPLPKTTCDDQDATQEKVNTELAWWGESNVENRAQVMAASRKVQQYLQDGENCNTESIFSYSDGSAIGVFVGANIQNNEAANTIIQEFLDQVQKITYRRMLIQYCGKDGAHTLGIVSESGPNSVAEVQKIVQKWSDAGCVTGSDGSSTLAGSIWTIPEKSPQILGLENASVGLQELFQGPQHIELEEQAAPERGHQKPLQKLEAPEELTGKSTESIKKLASTCSTIQVVSGDSCGSLVTKCHITSAQFTTFNPSPTLCSTLAVGQFVCCSAGSLPNLSPQPNPDGSCATFQVPSEDYCAKIAATNGITVAQIEAFNMKTWGWMGCNDLQLGATMCLSTGSPPMPAADPNAVCGPQVPGTPKPVDSVSLAQLNPCLLNACCDIWGQCGTVTDFCIDTRAATGAPGTAASGSNGCISNCGTAIVNNGAPPTVFRRIGYFEAWGVDRPCLAMDVTSVDVTKYTHIHFAFASITPDFNVDVSGVQDQFTKFKNLKNVLRVLSFGGWSFSTSADTAPIFRNGVSAAQQDTFAANVAAFVTANNLDGVDFDWEYPGATDIAGAPPGSPQDGYNYQMFLELMKSRLGNAKTVSIAAPASFWYLKGFPILNISYVVDYIVYMTYDLHGQWDYNSAWSNSGCPKGDCLVSLPILVSTWYVEVLTPHLAFSCQPHRDNECSQHDYQGWSPIE
jgi:chitinase